MDLLERSHQVNIMCQIYESAGLTLICLSTSRDIQSPLEWLSSLYKAYIESKKSEDPGWLTKQLHKTESDKPNSPTPNLKAFQFLLASPWWKRAWVFQEFVSPSTPYFLYSQQSIPGVDLVDIVHRVDMGDSDNWPVATQNVEDRWSRKSAIQEHIRDMGLHIRRFKRVIKRPRDDKPEIYLRGLLSLSWRFKASDERDEVFAFLYLTDPKYHIFPNYSFANGMTQVLTDVTRQIITVEANLDILLFAAASHEFMQSASPSWTVHWDSLPDFRFPRRNLLQSYGKAWNDIISYSTDSSSGNKLDIPHSTQFEFVTTPNGLVLSTSGIMISVIPGVTPGRFLQRICQLVSVEWASFVDEYLESAEGLGNLLFDEPRCSLSVKPMDQMWILYGCPVPLILRPLGDKYVLISEAIFFNCGNRTSSGGGSYKAGTNVAYHFFKAAQSAMIKSREVLIL
jgi:hypothetical protein